MWQTQLGCTGNAYGGRGLLEVSAAWGTLCDLSGNSHWVRVPQQCLTAQAPRKVWASFPAHSLVAAVVDITTPTCPFLWLETDHSHILFHLWYSRGHQCNHLWGQGPTAGTSNPTSFTCIGNWKSQLWDQDQLQLHPTLPVALTKLKKKNHFKILFSYKTHFFPLHIPAFTFSLLRCCGVFLV